MHAHWKSCHNPVLLLVIYSKSQGQNGLFMKNFFSIYLDVGRIMCVAPVAHKFDWHVCVDSKGGMFKNKEESNGCNVKKTFTLLECWIVVNGFGSDLIMWNMTMKVKWSSNTAKENSAKKTKQFTVLVQRALWH